MSWQAASMLLLAFALIGGALWYERSRPRPQVIALVAAMAALAAAGRVVFSPIPNVVPTTDLAVFSGYALGGAPGFMVGALSALVSNLWLGQGPWTPWQMAGWGLAGLFGAGLAVVTGRRLGRFGFAVACGLMGLLYGALLDYSAMVVFGGEQSLERYLALSVRGIPFNLAHAAGNFAIALVAGPAIVGLLERHRRRFTHRWEKSAAGRAGAGAASLLVLGCLVVGPLVGEDSARAEQPGRSSEATQSSNVSSAFSWLKRNQNSDGGFGFAPGRASDPATTGWAALAIAAAGRNPTRIRSGSGSSSIDYLRRHAGDIATTGDMERTILALAASGLDSRRFGGVRLNRKLRARVGSDGSLGGQVNLTAFYLLASTAAGVEPAARSIAWMKRAQAGSGGWGYGAGVDPDADSTGAAVQALESVGAASRAVDRGIAWLRRTQSRQGGWGLPGGSPNSQSTAWAVQGLVAAGRAPGRILRASRSPLDFLAARQARDGHYRYSASSDQTPVWVTAQAIAAVAGQPFPIAAVGKPSSTTATSPADSTDRSRKGGSDGQDAGGDSGPVDPDRADSSAIDSNQSSSRQGESGESASVGSAGDTSWISSWWWVILLGLVAVGSMAWLGVKIRDTARS